jgi:hypothetical protein
VDTGSDLVVVYGEGWEGSGSSVQRYPSQEGTSIAEPVAARPIMDTKLEIEGKQFRGLRTYCVPGAKGTGYDGFVGVRALKLRGISFDRDKQTLHLLN